MNTVNDLRRVLSDEVKRLQAPGGMERRVLEALQADSDRVGGAHRAGGRGQALPRRQHGRQATSRLPRLGALVASLLAFIVIITLVYGAQALRSTRNVPADGSRPGTVIAPVIVPAWSWFFSPKDAAVLVDIADPRNPGGVLAERLLITHDGGQSWLSTRVPAIVGGPRVFWIDRLRIVYIAANGIETTTDGGAHWTATQIEAGLEGGLWSTFFMSTTEGWAVQGKDVFHTTDSGAHWQKLATIGTASTTPAAQLLFTDRIHGFVSATNADGIGRYFQTSDGGRTWRLVELPRPAGGWPAAPSTVGVPTLFGSRGVLQLGVEGATVYLYNTSDGGATWSDPRLLANAAGQPVFTDVSHGWTVDGEGRAYVTADGGRTWNQITYRISSGYLLVTVAPVATDTVWGVARSGAEFYLVKSADGGSSWAFVKLPSE